MSNDTELNDETRNSIIGVMAAVLSVDKGAINSEASMLTLENWDSLHQLNLVLALEEKFSVQLTPDDIRLMNSFTNICNVLDQKLS